MMAFTDTGEGRFSIEGDTECGGRGRDTDVRIDIKSQKKWVLHEEPNLVVQLLH